ncbi:MAG: BPL-N domain-containing protein [Candidatus Thorarchaeota archaeon]|jgi:glutamine amidotransferase-like uncharacterized protein
MKLRLFDSHARHAVTAGIALLLLAAAPFPSVAQTHSTTDLDGVAVAIYGDGGADASRDGWLALGAMFEWMNASVTYVMASDIRNGTLDDYEIVVMPGGPPVTYRVFLQEDGMDEIRSFVSDGGSYVGICGGSEFATTQFLGLHQGRINWGIAGSGTGVINMTLNVNSTGPDFSDMSETFTVMNWGSGPFTNITDDVIPIATYPQNGRPGMIAFPYGRGSVFLSSPHPEFEEESDRDGTTDFDELDDPDSEWPIMLRVACWLLDSSIVTDATDSDSFLDSLGIFGIAIGGTIALVVIVAIYVKRR